MATLEEEPANQRWLSMTLLVAILYPAVGIGFAALDSLSGSAPIRTWRLAAWFMSAAAFGAHLAYEHLRVGSAQESPLAPLALVLFPVVTGVPAFVVALATVAILVRLRQHQR